MIKILKNAVPDVVIEKASAETAPPWCKEKTTSVSDVEWGNSAQIVFRWNDSEDLSVFIDFVGSTQGEKVIRRDQILDNLYRKYKGRCPKESPSMRYRGARSRSFVHSGFIGPDEVIKAAGCAGWKIKIIYAADGDRAGMKTIMEKIGLPIGVGETGKEFIDGEYVPYRRPPGRCL